MRSPDPVLPVLLFFSVTAGERALLAEVERVLELEFGPLAHGGPLHRGAGLGAVQGNGVAARRLHAVDALVDRAELPSLAGDVLRLEAHLNGGDRAVRARLEVGYVSSSQVILATPSERRSAVWIGGGIRAELQLVWEEGEGWCPLPWTSAEYHGENLRKEFAWLRRLLMLRIEATPDPLGLFRTGVGSVSGADA